VLPPAAIDPLRAALTRHRYTPDGVRDLLGPSAHAALGRGEVEPAFRASRDGGELGVLVRLLLLGGVEPDAAVRAALAPLDPADVPALLRRDGDGWRAELDLRPYGDDDGDWWVLSDLDSRRQDREHVTGVGAASLTLAAATDRTPVGTLLDLGTGCGVQALHATRHARSVTATDVAPRALALARATFALNGIDVELLDGPWLEPVAGRRFDRIVSNPPFVPGPPRVDYVYRDSGRGGDDALAALVADLPAHLEPGGVAQLLGSWLHVRGQDWPDRVRSWLPDGVDAWIVQREVADPALHVGTWQRDAGLDLGSPAARAQAGAWLDWLEGAGVEAVGFGFLLLRRTDSDPAVVVEDLLGEVTDPLGPEVTGWLARVDWLRAHARDEALLDARLTVPDGVVLESWSEPGPADDPGAGWVEAGRSVALLDGPRWRHEVDAPAAALLAGCRGALPLRELLELLSFAHDRPVDELVAATLPAVREFVRHGLLVPAGPTR
jgi:methylase of polypeptide subunit release factors